MLSTTERLALLLLSVLVLAGCSNQAGDEASNQDTDTERPRVIATTDGEIDDQSSMVRFLLYTNEFDVEGIIKTSSQYHARGDDWAGDDWIQPYLDGYAEVYPNLVKHDEDYPAPESLESVTHLGNVESEGAMDEKTPGSQHIVDVLLDESDDQPIWLQAWGGTNTIARALKTIEEEHPDRMESVANKIRFYFIWEQDSTYQSYIKPNWGEYNIPTIISDQFLAMAYEDQRRAIPEEMKQYYSAEWMNQNLLQDHGPLLDLYRETAHDDGRFRSEGDTPAFLHVLPTGLRSAESPGWGGWGGRFVNVRNNTWLDPVPDPEYEYPEGRWYTETAYGRVRLRKQIPNDEQLIEYFKPQWRWLDVIQNDFAARADWTVQSYEEANHPPEVELAHARDLTAEPGDTVQLSAEGTQDPDGDELDYQWWQYPDADSYSGTIDVQDAGSQEASFTVPADAETGDTIHVICEVRDDGSPQLTRYQRVVVTVSDS